MGQDFFDLHLKCLLQVSLVSNQSTCARNDINERMGMPVESKRKKVSRNAATPLFRIVREPASSRLGRAHGTASIWNRTSHVRKVRPRAPLFRISASVVPCSRPFVGGFNQSGLCRIVPDVPNNTVILLGRPGPMIEPFFLPKPARETKRLICSGRSPVFELGQ